MTLKITLRPRQLIQGQETEMTITLHNRGSAPCTNLVFTFQLPSQIMLLRGSHRLQIPRLEGGASWQHRLRVLPKEAGRFTFRSANFSYRDSHGISQRPPSRETSLEVLPPRPAPPAPEPRLRLFIREAHLREGEWGSVLVDLANEGYATAYQITVIVRGRVDCKPARTPELPPGGVAHLELATRALEPGRVPVLFEAAGRDPRGGSIKVQTEGFLQVVRFPEKTEPGGVQINVTDSVIGEIAPHKTETHMGDVVSIQRTGTTPESPTPGRPRLCPNCGHELANLEGAKFCSQCAHPLTR